MRILWDDASSPAVRFIAEERKALEEGTDPLLL